MLSDLLQHTLIKVKEAKIEIVIAKEREIKQRSKGSYSDLSWTTTILGRINKLDVTNKNAPEIFERKENFGNKINVF